MLTGFQAQMNTSDSWPRRMVALLGGISTFLSISMGFEWLSVRDTETHTVTPTGRRRLQNCLSNPCLYVLGQRCLRGLNDCGHCAVGACVLSRLAVLWPDPRLRMLQAACPTVGMGRDGGPRKRWHPAECHPRPYSVSRLLVPPQALSLTHVPLNPETMPRWPHLARCCLDFQPPKLRAQSLHFLYKAPSLGRSITATAHKYSQASIH